MFGFGGANQSDLHVGVITDVKGKEQVDSLNTSLKGTTDVIGQMIPGADKLTKFLGPLGLATAAGAAGIALKNLDRFTFLMDD
jgi:hypothetical protein